MAETTSLPSLTGSSSTSPVLTPLTGSDLDRDDAKSGFDNHNDEDPVCIVGLACRLPGGIDTPSDLWNFIVNKQTAQNTVPLDRFNIKGFNHPGTRDRGGVMRADGGYFLKRDVRQFDNSFFGINNLETTYMDPQQRQLLEVVFECFENAGVSMEDVSGTNIGVYVGNYTVDYQAMQMKDIDYASRHMATGSGTAILSNRISHIFNLHGPSFTIDTACSSTIYCIHNAVRAIQAGDCDGAIVAGANLITSPEQHLGTSMGGVLSPTSTCHTFDISADGYGRGEGINAVYLKRLSSALKDGDKISGVIRGTAVNANGHTAGISLPSAALQEVVIRKAYSNAGLEFSGTDYVECHGTGTSVGDPIEVDALASCFAQRQGVPVMLGSVKTNLGHSEAASGLTSLLKVALAFEHDCIPPTFGVTKLNPKLKLESRNFKVVTEVESWPRSLQRASINSFGYGGANAHVIVESISSYLNSSSSVNRITKNDENLPIVVLPVSASSKKSLELRIQQLDQIIKTSDSHTLQRLAFTLAQRRSHLGHRQYILAKATPGENSQLLEIDPAQASSTSSNPLPIAMIFTGQGAQYVGMSKELLTTDETFATTIRQLDQTLQGLPQPLKPDWTLEQTILDTAETSQVNNVTRSQPLCTAIQIGLVNILRGWDVSPSAVVGHSSGEIAAAYTAGLLSAEQAILIAYFRGYVVGQEKARGGAMIAVGLSAEAAGILINEHGLEGRVSVACVNSPDSATLSGSPDGVDKIEEEIKAIGKFARKLETGGRAYHSHMMSAVGELYEELLVKYLDKDTFVDGKQFTAKMYSSVGLMDDQLRVFETHISTSKYWRENLEKPVQFSSAVQALVTEQGRHHLIEIGPHAALKGPLQQIRSALKMESRHLPYTGSLIRKQDASMCMRNLAGALFLHGHKLNWTAVNGLPSSDLKLLDNLPTYPWDYSTLLWYEPRSSVELRNREHVRHELLGSKQVAGNGIDFNFRNILRLSEMPWLRGHKVEDQIVFPAAGYLAVIVEAMSQLLGLKDGLVDQNSQPQGTTFRFLEVSISAALVVYDDNDEPGKGVELHTTLSQRKLSSITFSSGWYDFSISSWLAGRTIVHCAGRVRANDSAQTQTSVTISNPDRFESWSTATWYAKSKAEGLCFEDDFKSLTTIRTDGNRRTLETICTAQLVPSIANNPDSMYYSMHPITIDTCFQASIVGVTKGNLKEFRAYLPVFISECQIHTSGRRASIDGEATVQTRSTRTGPSTIRIDSTVRDPNGLAVIDFKDVRLSLYKGKQREDTQDSDDPSKHGRSPYLSTTWKPDISRLDFSEASHLNAYIDEQRKQLSDTLARGYTQTVRSLIDLAGHKNPKLRVLEVGGGSEETKQEFINLLDKDGRFPRCRLWEIAAINEQGELQLDDLTAAEFDIVYIPEDVIPEQNWTGIIKKLASLVAENGSILSPIAEVALTQLRATEYTVLDVQDNTLLATRHKKPSLFKDRPLFILVHKPSPLTLKLAAALESHIQKYLGVGAVSTVHLKAIETAEISSKTICISLLETEREFLGSLEQEEMDLLRIMTDTVTELLWLTGANKLKSPNPNLMMSDGFSRTLMLEQPAMRFSVFDIGAIDLAITNTESTCDNVVKCLRSSGERDDKEFTQLNGLIYVSRFVPNKQLNSLFQRRLATYESLEKVALNKASPARLSFGQPGVTESMYFQQLCEPLESLPPGFIDVDLKAVSLNAKDIYTVSGLVETKTATTAIEFSGIVAAVGSDVDHLQPGDRVVVSSPNYFTTRERVPAWAAHKMLPAEEFSVVATLPVVYSTALYALEDRTHLRAGESILIHSGAGALGIAMISVAQLIGAVVYVTVGSQAKRDFLTRELGVPDDHIFSSRDSSFVEGLKVATGGRGVDVIINSLIGDLMHATWECIAQFGRFVEVGKRELSNAGKLNMHQFLRNATFTAFDLSDLYFSEDPYYRNVWISKTKKALELYRSKQIKPMPLITFDVADTAQAYRYFSTKDRIGKVVISLEDVQSAIPVLPAKHLTVFNPNKIYLLVGCLGGLGRSLSRYMLERGARNFCFLGRSGDEKPSAQVLIKRLRDAGATVTVVKGDVSSAADVNAAVAACKSLPIGGVVQAAMGLDEALFSRMSSEAWQTSVRPKWAGTWNLHNAVGEAPLDFFLMTSSMSGSIGVATESNYCVGNCFLDAFARWRRSQGKSAVAVGLGMISEVGYLHENPDIEAMLLRKGIQPLNEEEFLQVIDIALAGPQAYEEDALNDHEFLERSHILTGLEPIRYRKLMAQGYDTTVEVVLDPRASLLAAAVAAEKDALSAAGQTNAANLSQLANAAPWLKVIPSNIVSSFLSEVDATSIQNAVLRLTKKRFSNLILMPADQIDELKPLSQFGVDSMLAAEFRTWFWASFKVDIPFLDLLSPQKDLNSLADFVAAKIDGASDTGAS